jgi:two-component system sensor histidine kinase YesM
MEIGITADETSPKRMGRLVSAISHANLPLRSKMMLSFFVVILLLVIINTLMIFEALRVNRQYADMINNVTTANSITGFIKPAIDTEMWNIVAGKIDFDEGKQYQILDQVNDQIDSLVANSLSDKSVIKLEVTRRTLGTLTKYVDKMGEQIEAGSRVAENELVLEDIRGVSEVVEETVQDYMLFEVQQAEQLYRENQSRFNRWILVYFILLPCVIGFSFAAAWVISASIYMPIKKLQDLTTTIAQDDLQGLVDYSNVDEITELGLSFNVMTSRVRELLDAKVREQENLKKAELKALQAQINPHFLYNTLDTIVWMAEANKTDEVIELVRSLSSFFRIALSRGRDWIPIRQEIEHVRSYLHIQRIRYRDILDYEFDIDEKILDGTILKLTLQPLAENALYHGIKNKRDGGKITIRARQAGDDLVLLEVQDDGIGCTPYKLGKIREQLDEESDVVSRTDEGFGLSNVNKRIKLYYGEEYGLSIESRYQEGTKITVAIPLQENLEGELKEEKA